MITSGGDVTNSGEFRQCARVLVVDDDELMRATVVTILRSGGYDVRAAPGGLAALEMAAQCAPFELLVTDICMPDMNGHELARRMRVDFADLPVLLISGTPHEAQNASDASDAQTLFLAKPFTVEQLLRRVVELTARA